MVVYTTQRDDNNSKNKSEDFTQAGSQRIIVSQPQVDFDTAQEITSVKHIASTLGLNVERIKDDAFMAKHTTLQFKRQLDDKIDGLETSLVRHFSNSQQHLVDEIALLKSQVAEMVDCLKELRDAKKGEGTSSKKRRML
ncbi:LOB domain-containing protein 24-like [Dorcoceras hygrometricum]|uniref:LOB domain-containing protein 24-like n=1 Tax=Dorcoceras hygrometricum TaxID=472368 RepID=A0A2Z7CD93_9LAMI|nr:LOB domain-containing protein 24-like [Dorcoceras hygrometricum]